MNYQNDWNELVELILNSSSTQAEKGDILFALRSIAHQLEVLSKNNISSTQFNSLDPERFFSKENLQRLTAHKN
ncbi:MAG: hypothetical protein RIB54_01010 [Fulvivirga sp.]|uniref:hypothetical protein n=1 Tax=Fulvivirga sp. TaxID=1931237 RepID=UPI0032EB2648